MNNYISLHVSAYRKGCSSQHVLIRRLEEWRRHLDNNKVVRGCFYGLIKSLRLRTTRSVISKTGSILCCWESTYFIYKASAHHFADDNSLSAFESNIKTLKTILESESKKTISWFQSNKMIFNPGKFQGIIIDKKKQNHTVEYISIDRKNIKISLSVKLLGYKSTIC